MPPKDKKVVKTAFKQGLAAKDILPPSIKNPPRESKPLRRPQEVVTENKSKFFQQYQSLDEWPGDEVARNFDFGLNSDKVFKQSDNIFIPEYFQPTNQESQVKWSRPKDMLSSEKPFEIFQIQEREETPSEFEERKRLEEEEKKKLKKGNKKDESGLDDIPKKVKQCVQNNICLNGLYPVMSRWIASCFQLIKDTGITDVNNKEKLFNKIYPQNAEGIPIFNPSGRYWVKLYFRGKLRKIEVDDRILFYNKQQVMPRCSGQNLLWPQLFTKALMKLQENNWDKQLERNQNHCDGMVLYALTGSLPEILSIKEFNLENFQYIKRQLSDSIYDNKDTIISCLKIDKNSDPLKRSLSQNQIASATTSQQSSHLSSSRSSLDGDKNSNSFRKSRSQSKSNQVQNAVNDKEIGEDKKIGYTDTENFVVNSVQYYLIESFFNENFNMVYVKERNEVQNYQLKEEIKLRQDYFNLCKQNIHKLSKEEKLDYRKLKKDQRERINEEERKRQELITKPPVQYRLFSLKSKFEKVANLKFKCPFSQKEIFIAKKCIINKLSKPPNYDITGNLQQIQDARGNDQESQTVINQDKSFEIKPLDEFNLPNIIDPKERQIKGSWIQEFDIVNHFDYMFLYHNENKFPFRKFLNIANSLSEEFSKDESNELLLIGEDSDQKTIELFIAFQSNMVSNPTGMTIMPQFILQKYDFNTFELVQNIKTLNRQFDGFTLQLDKGVYLFKLQTLTPVGYSLWINSNTSFQTMSIQQYITKNLKYLQKQFSIEHITGEKDMYMLFGKFKIISNQTNDLFVKVKSQAEPDSFLTKYLRLKLVKENDKQQTVMRQDMEGVYINEFNKTFLNITDFNKLSLQQGNYNLVLEGIAPFNIPEGKIEIEFFSKDEIQIEQLEFVEPVEYQDRYIPNKTGIIFSERIFVPETVYCSFFVNLVRQTQSGQKDPKDPKKVIEFTESDLLPQRLIMLELLDEDRVIMSKQGMNFCWISDVILPKTDRNYYLKASFDLRDWPDCKLQTEDTKDIQWYLRLSGATNTIVLIKDTQKEERERAIQKSWEDKEPGRAEKSKKSRKKYKALLKKEKGEPLDAEEIALLNETRLSKKQKEELAKQAVAQKGKAAPAKKETKKGVEEVLDVKQTVVNYPKSIEHHMEEITDYLQRLESDIIQNEYSQHQGEINVRSLNEYRELQERLALSTEDFNSQLLRNLTQRDKMKQYQFNLMEQLVQSQEKSQIEFHEKIKNIMEQRNVLKDDLQNKKSIKKQMMDIYTKEKPTIQEIELVIKNAQETNNEEQLEIGQMLLNNARIYQILDDLTYGVENFELQKIESNLDIIQQYKLNVEQDLLEKAYEIADESKINPKYCEEKQAEAKKGGKAKKK